MQQILAVAIARFAEAEAPWDCELQHAPSLWTHVLFTATAKSEAGQRVVVS